MSKEPLVSVILTTFNRRQMVERVLNSILAQDYSILEVIVVDDSSSDETESFFKAFRDPRVIYIRHDRNRGVQYASITGFERSSGDYLIFCGDDDVWNDPNRLKKQVATFEQDLEGRLGITTCSVRVVGREYIYIKTIKRPKNLVKHLLERNGIIYGSAAMIRRRAYELAGGFDPYLVKGTDSDVFRRIVLLGYDVFISEEPMINYSEAPAGRMTTLDEKGMRRTISAQSRVLQKYSQYFNDNKKTKKRRCLILADTYLKLFYRTASKTAREGALVYARRSFGFGKVGLKAMFLYIKILLGFEVIKKNG